MTAGRPRRAPADTASALVLIVVPVVVWAAVVIAVLTGRNASP